MKYAGRAVYGWVIGGTMLLVGTTATASDLLELERGYDAARQGYYDEAAKTFDQLADKGDPRAKFNLALMYHSGLGVGRDEAEAVRLYHAAAAEGYAPAQEYLAAGYGEGWFGLEKDPKKARFWDDLATGQQ